MEQHGLGVFKVGRLSKLDTADLRALERSMMNKLFVNNIHRVYINKLFVNNIHRVYIYIQPAKNIKKLRFEQTKMVI
jgi:hypothetical protein